MIVYCIAVSPPPVLLQPHTKIGAEHGGRNPDGWEGAGVVPHATGSGIRQAPGYVMGVNY